MRRGPLAPELPYVPLFEQLRRYTRAMQATYGAIAAFQHARHRPTVREIAFAARIQLSQAKEAIRQLVDSNMLRRVNVGEPKSRVRYELLGPTLAMVTSASLLELERQSPRVVRPEGSPVVRSA
jgi:hypothetical protein